jgi:putative NADH-flavin reductase
MLYGSFNPGTRTGSYRVGDDVLLRDENGISQISGPDYAIAFVDELETPEHHRTRFTVAY